LHYYRNYEVGLNTVLTATCYRSKGIGIHNELGRVLHLHYYNTVNFILECFVITKTQL